MKGFESVIRSERLSRRPQAVWLLELNGKAFRDDTQNFSIFVCRCQVVIALSCGQPACKSDHVQNCLTLLTRAR